jgi:hypothetical protein
MLRGMLILMVLSAIGGCVTTGPTPPSTRMAAVRPAPETQRLFTIGTGGWQVRRLVNVPGDVCNLQAFEEGYAAAYMRSWNQRIGNRDQVFLAMVKRNPKDPVARHNFELYKDKHFDLRGIRAVQYAPKMDEAWHLSTACQADSYLAGQNAGTEGANEDYRELAAKEIR